MVAQAIGLGVGDIGLLCADLKIEKVTDDNGDYYQATAERANRINKWSKWKPIIYASVKPITDTILAQEKCGFNNITLSSGCIGSLSSFVIKYINDYSETIATQFQWLYSPPTGGSDSPYRLGDFRNYESNAKPMFKVLTDSNGNAYTGTNRMVVAQYYPAQYYRRTFYLNPNQPDGISGITPSDIIISGSTTLTGYYLGVMLVDLSNSLIVMIKTNEAASPLSVRTSIALDLKPYSSIDNAALIFFLSPRALGELNIEGEDGGDSVPTQTDYVLISNPFYPAKFVNGADEDTTLWYFDATEDGANGLLTPNNFYSPEVSSNTEASGGAIVKYVNLEKVGISFEDTTDYLEVTPNLTSGHPDSLSLYGIDSDSNYLIEIEQHLSGVSSSTSGTPQCILAYATAYESINSVTYKCLSIAKHSDGSTTLYIDETGTAEDDTHNLEYVTFNDIAKIIVRNFNSSTQALGTIEVQFFDTAGDVLGTYSFTGNMFMPAAIKVGYPGSTFGTVIAPSWYISYLAINTMVYPD